MARDDRDRCRECGHAWSAHQHYRGGTDCSAVVSRADRVDPCPCRAFRPSRWWHRFIDA